MANFFSADYWKALYFKAFGGQATATDANAMSGSFAGSSVFSGAIEAIVLDAPVQFDGHDGKPRQTSVADDMAELRRWWAQEDENRREHARRVAADNEDRRRALAKAFGLDPAEEPEIAAPHIPGPTIEEKRERLKALTALLDYPKPAPTDKPVLFDWATLKVRRNRKAVLDADRIAREEARALADQIRQEIQDYDDALILLLLAA